MKKVIVYIAWDDTEFETEEECKNYEQHALDMMVELCHCYTLYDKDGNELEVFVPNSIEDMMKLFERNASVCEKVRVNRVPSDSADAFQNSNFGFDMPEEEGLFVYDWNCVRWDKVAE